MTAYRARPMPIKLGVFLVPDASDVDSTIGEILAPDQAGLDFVGVQDHPYQWRFFDTWTLLAYAAGRTERVRFVPDVLNLPLRLPTLVAKSVASLDVLSGGRVELGIGAGAFWDAVEAMGGPRRTAGESVDALEEALEIVHAFWSGERSVNFAGHHYRVNGAHPGPPPAHPVGVWLGAYGPRMLRLTGRLADGWLPSLGGHYLRREDVPGTPGGDRRGRPRRPSRSRSDRTGGQRDGIGRRPGRVVRAARQHRDRAPVLHAAGRRA